MMKVETPCGAPDTDVGIRPQRSLPFLIGGRRVDPPSTGPRQKVTTRFGEIEVPQLTEGLATQLLTIDKHQLVPVPLQEILAFLNRVGRLWKNKEYTRRRMYVRQLHDYLGYSEKMAIAEADWIASILTSHARSWDQLEVELGSRFILDEWIRREDSYVRAFPRGLSVHVTSGNVPTAAIASIIRALLTKNVVVVRPSADDLVTSLSFAFSMLDLDKNHPVAKSMNVVYWPHGDAYGEEILGAADAVCAWGGADAIRWAYEHTSPEAAFLPFGPKRSVAVIGRLEDQAKAAKALAHDVCLYDQRACFSVQQVFIEGPSEGFLKELRHAFDRFRDVYPSGKRSFNDLANTALTRRTDEFFGALCVDGGDWTIVCASPQVPARHPLGRYLYIHEVADLEEIGPFLDAGVQTVAMMPWSICQRYRDEWAARGVTRFTEIGLNNLFRLGTSHDDMYPLARLVRFVSTELPASTHGKGMVLEIDLTELLTRGELADLVQ